LRHLKRELWTTAAAGEAQWMRTASACARAAADGAASRCSVAARAAAWRSAASASVACAIATCTGDIHAPQSTYMPQLPVVISPSPHCHDYPGTQSCHVRKLTNRLPCSC